MAFIVKSVEATSRCVVLSKTHCDVLFCRSHIVMCRLVEATSCCYPVKVMAFIVEANRDVPCCQSHIVMCLFVEDTS